MALADGALELLYIIEVLSHIGFEFDFTEVTLETDSHEASKVYDSVRDIRHGPVEVGTDNKGAHDLCHRTTNGSNSRHVERKVYKMRELSHEGKVSVVLVPGVDNEADIFTKVLNNKTCSCAIMTLFTMLRQSRTRHRHRQPGAHQRRR